MPDTTATTHADDAAIEDGYDGPMPWSDAYEYAAEGPTLTEQATQLRESLTRLAAFVYHNPDMVEPLRMGTNRLWCPVGGRERVAAFARAGARAGATVTKHADNYVAGVDITFGAVTLRIYASREEVCERIVVGTQEVTEEVPDPVLLEAVPTVVTTRTVEIVEWRCPPLLAEEEKQT